MLPPDFQLDEGWCGKQTATCLPEDLEQAAVLELAHDHPGTLTTFPLAASLKTPVARAYITGVYQDAGRLAELPGPSVLSSMAFHDLGWYDFLYTLLVIVPVFPHHDVARQQKADRWFRFQRPVRQWRIAG